MEKLRLFYSYLLGMNLAYSLVLALVVKALINDISYAAFLLTIPVLGFEAYKLYLKTKTPDPIALDAEVRRELDNIKSKLNASALEKGVIPVASGKRYF